MNGQRRDARLGVLGERYRVVDGRRVGDAYLSDCHLRCGSTPRIGRPDRRSAPIKQSSVDKRRAADPFTPLSAAIGPRGVTPAASYRGSSSVISLGVPTSAEFQELWPPDSPIAMPHE
jgi:hypothetical protein